MADFTLHTGLAGDIDIINIDWFNHNNNRRKEVIEVIIQTQDKPRTLEIKLNGETIAIIPNKD